MGGEDAAGKIPGDFEAEMKQALKNIDAVLKAGGMSSNNVVSVQVYLTDGSYIRANERSLPSILQGPTTRTTVVVAKLVGQGHIEITATARK